MKHAQDKPAKTKDQHNSQAKHERGQTWWTYSGRDLSGPKPKLTEIRPGHYVFMNDRERQEYEVKLQAMEKEANA